MSKRIGKTLTLCVCAVFIFGTASILADPIIFLDDFTGGVMWDLDTESCTGFACETDSLGRMYVTNWGSCGQGWRGMEIPLCREIGTNEDFIMSFKFMALSDLNQHQGFVNLRAVTADDENVARIQWYDSYIQAGYGGVFFRVEDDIDYEGPNNEYPVFNGVMEIRRTGNRWSFWVNNEQKFSTVEYEPTRIISKLQISYYINPSYPVRDFYVDQVKVRCHAGGDVNADRAGNVGDAVYLINWIFKGGTAPVEPDDAGCSPIKFE